MRTDPVPRICTGLPPIPFTRPLLAVNFAKSLALFMMRRLAPVSRTYATLSVSATKQYGSFLSFASGSGAEMVPWVQSNGFVGIGVCSDSCIDHCVHVVVLLVAVERRASGDEGMIGARDGIDSRARGEGEEK
jgi:hypothetical protein